MNERYISLKDAQEKLGVTRGTLRYYLDHLGIGKKKFPLDKHTYIRMEDFERIRTYKKEALERSQQSELVVGLSE